jgi:hypothetical protein
MAFKLSNEANSWFSTINEDSTTGEFAHKWDMYYFAAMVGISASERVGTDQEPDSTAFNKNLASAYSNQKFEIYSALVMAEIERQNIPKGAKAEIRELMLEILDSNDQTRLSSEGKTLLNCYAEMGYKILRDAGPPPTEFDRFLELFVNQINS